MDRQYFKQNAAPSTVFHNTVNHVFDIIRASVGSTFGPYGTHNIFLNGSEVSSSKDGLENLVMMKMDSSIARMIHQITTEVAQNQASEVGDGTTSAVMILANVYSKLHNSEELRSNYTPSAINAAVQVIQKALVEQLRVRAMPIRGNGIKLSDEIDKIFSIVYTSTDRNAELAELLVDMYTHVPDIENRNVIIQNSNQHTYWERVKGLNIHGRLFHEAFANYDIDTLRLENVDVIVVDGAPTIESGIGEYINKLKFQGRSLLIICTGVQNMNFKNYVDALYRQQPQAFSNFAVVFSNINSHAHPKVFNDLVVVTGSEKVAEGTVINDKTIEEIRVGKVKNVLLKNRNLTLAGFEDNEGLTAHLANLENQINNARNEVSVANTTEDRAHKQVALSDLLYRYNSLGDGEVTLYVGGETTQRRSINYRLLEDGLKAMQSAIKTGYFQGCNVTVPNILFNMMVNHYSRNNQKRDIYVIIYELLLSAYLETYHHMVSNRSVVSFEEFLEMTATKSVCTFYSADGKWILNPELQCNWVDELFVPLNLSNDETADGRILNPAATDINIVEKAIDAATALATANTILSDGFEFDSRVN